MSVTLKVDAQVVEQGTPYLIELPSALKISDNGIFLGQELFLIEIKKQLAVIFLKNNFKKKYKVNDLEIIINAPKVRSEFFKEEIYLKKLSRDEKSLGLYFLGVTVFIIGNMYCCPNSMFLNATATPIKTITHVMGYSTVLTKISSIFVFVLLTTCVK